jgi:hypothetical protein
MEKLNGRVRWKCVVGGVRIEIPMRFNWAALPVLISAFFVPFFVDDIVRKSPLHGRGLDLLQLLAASLIMMAISTVPALGSKRVVHLTREHLRFGTEALGRKLRHRTFSTNLLYDIRSNPVVSEWTGKDLQNRLSVEIGYGQRYQTLASGLTDDEAKALIAKMTEVVTFPKSLEIRNAYRK